MAEDFSLDLEALRREVREERAMDMRRGAAVEEAHAQQIKVCSDAIAEQKPQAIELSDMQAIQTNFTEELRKSIVAEAAKAVADCNRSFLQDLSDKGILSTGGLPTNIASLNISPTAPAPAPSLSPSPVRTSSSSHRRNITPSRALSLSPSLLLPAEPIEIQPDRTTSLTAVASGDAHINAYDERDPMPVRRTSPTRYAREDGGPPVLSLPTTSEMRKVNENSLERDCEGDNTAATSAALETVAALVKESLEEKIKVSFDSFLASYRSEQSLVSSRCLYLSIIRSFPCIALKLTSHSK
jgi:hypothetical protein